MGIKERRTKILLSLFLITDVNFQPIVFDQNKEIIFDLSFNQKTRGTIAGLIKEGAIEKGGTVKTAAVESETVTNDQLGTITQTETIAFQEDSVKEQGNQYRLTYKGFEELCLSFPFFRFLVDKWDGRWRILSYEIPEKKRDLRDRLRREVAGWGLGPWHRSFWITPHPIILNLKDLVSQKEEEQYIQAFEAEHVFGDREILIEKVWQKSSLDKKYRELFKRWHDILSKEDEKPQKLRKVIDEYIGLLREDPGLPPELIGQNWIGFEAFNIFKEIRGILLS